MNLFDASALLCFLQNEEGSDIVERQLVSGGSCSAANWSEVVQKLIAHGRDWELARSLLLTYGMEIEPVYADDAELAARLWRSGSGLSSADRLCLATSQRLGATVWTSDSAWGESEAVRQIRRTEPT
jgi:PIN domain nuclease of toxin-antitoxin system